MKQTRYFILYLMTPLIAIAAAMLVNGVTGNSNHWMTMMVEGVAAVGFWSLAIVTEGTMRAYDDLIDM